MDHDKIEEQLSLERKRNLMQSTFTPFKNLAFLTGALICFQSDATDTATLHNAEIKIRQSSFNSNLSSIPKPYCEKRTHLSIKELYHKLNDMPNISMPERIDWISQQFLGSPYLLGALGEGASARYDQFPQYRLDAFDCDTYVNTVLALALSHSLLEFKQCIKHMRYFNGNVSYINRTHFTGLDWNQYHQQQAVLKDITLNIKEANNHTVAQLASALIEKPSWYAHKRLATIRLRNKDTIKQNKLLIELKAKGAKLKASLEEVAYLPFTALFLQKNKPNMYLFNQIPQGAIIEIVRPNWDLKKQIGTSLNISHLGFAIWKKGRLFFRQSSSEHYQTIDVPLIEYLQNAQNSPTIRGINVQVVNPAVTSSKDCKKLVSIKD